MSVLLPWRGLGPLSSTLAANATNKNQQQDSVETQEFSKWYDKIDYVEKLGISISSSALFLVLIFLNGCHVGDPNVEDVLSCKSCNFLKIVFSIAFL